MRFVARVPSLLAALVCLTALAPAAPQSPSSADLVRVWDADHVSSPISPLVDHAEVKRRIGELKSDLLRVSEIGKSLEGREIYEVTFGNGPFVVLMWSQMHGDEPTATSGVVRPVRVSAAPPI
jgi:hypothetical protein